MASRSFATAVDAVQGSSSSHLLPPSLAHLDSSKRPDGYVEASDANQRQWIVFSREIEKSESDDRQYRIIRLKNGLEAVLISDPSTDKAAAALSVRVGHLSDPEELQGLAHFCEHLLFMGTKKYPRENDYNEFLSSHSGHSNAFTGMDETTYYFDVHPDALDGALDRFSQFFISPLFDASCTEREIQAVDSENKKNLQSDMWRLFQLEKSLSSREHAYWRFGTGNLETLWTSPRAKGLDVRDELLKFHRQHYSANLMKLAVVGKQSLDELAALVVDRLSEAEDKNLPFKSWPSSPYTAKELKTQILAKTVKDRRTVEIAFPIKDQDDLFASKPFRFLGHFLGHEGEGSILSLLKRRGWANGLGCGNGGGATGFDIFKVSVDLTKEGLNHYEEIASIVFKYIELLKSTPPQEWAFKEAAMLGEMEFRFQDKAKPANYATHLCSELHKPYPREWLLSAPYLWRSFDRDQIAGALSNLSVDNCRVTVSSQQPLPGFEYDHKEQWYGTQYAIAPLPSVLLEAKQQPEADLALPKPNSFMPDNLDIIGRKVVDKPAQRPSLLRETSLSRVWHKKDDRWWLPKASVLFLLRSPVLDDTAEHAISAKLFCDLVNDSLDEYSYDADLAGLSYNLVPQANGIILNLGGYNDKLPVLMRVVAERMKGFKADRKRFDIAVEELSRNLANFRLGQPSHHAAYHASHLTIQRMYMPDEQLAALQNLTLESLQQYIDMVLQRVHIQALVHGNVVKDDALHMVKELEEILKPEALAKEEIRVPLCLLLPRGSNHVYRRDVEDPEQLNSAVEFFLYIGDDENQHQRVRLQLFNQLASEPCFDQLRTREQLGYIVQSSARGSIGMHGFRVLVQSERDAEYVESRIEAWLQSFRQLIVDMSDDDFITQRTSLINRKLEDHKNMNSETHAYWMHIHSGYYDFLRRGKDAKEISKLDKQDILTFIDTYILPSSPQRAKLSVHLRSQRLNVDGKEALLAALHTQGLDASGALQTQLGSGPTLVDIAAFVEKDLSENGAEKDKVDAVLQVVKGLKAPPTQDNVKLVTDAEAFRRSLEVGPSSKPVEEFRDWLAHL